MMRNDEQRGARRILSGLCLGLFATLVTLGALELIVRTWLDEGSAFLRKDPIVGHRFHASYEEDVYSPSAGRVVHRQFNRLGFRGPDRPFEKPGEVRRVAVLGDSFTASTALDEADTLPVVLERRLNETGGMERWEALNFGVDAYSPAQSLLVWRALAQSFRPDVVLLMFFNGNDVSDDDRRLTGYPRPYFHLDELGELQLDPVAPLAASVSAWLGEHSRLYVWQKKRVQTLTQRIRRGTGQAAPAVTLYLDSMPDAAIEQSWVLTEKILLALANEVTATGAQFVLVSVPDFVQVRDADWAEALRRVDPSAAARLQRDYPERRLGAFARAHEIPFVPLLDTLRRQAPTADVYLGDGHWNDVGIRAAAEVLLGAIKEDPERGQMQARGE